MFDINYWDILWDMSQVGQKSVPAGWDNVWDKRGYALKGVPHVPTEVNPKISMSQRTFGVKNEK